MLVGAGVGGGLLLGWALTPRRFAPPLAPGKDEIVTQAAVEHSIAVPQSPVARAKIRIALRERGVHYGSTKGADFAVATKWNPAWDDMPLTLDLYGWDAKKMGQLAAPEGGQVLPLAPLPQYALRKERKQEEEEESSEDEEFYRRQLMAFDITKFDATAISC